MPVRNIKKSHISVNGFFSSYKNNRQINFESKLEHDFYLLLEFNNNVVSYQEQPFQINYTYENKKRRYTPDVLVNYIDGTQKVFEIKPYFKIENDEILRVKMQLQKEKIEEEKGLEFRVFTDKDINKIYLENAKVIYNFAFLEVDKIISDKIKNEILNSSDSISVKELLNSLTNTQNERLKYIPYLWNLVFRNLECIDFTKKITMSSMIDPKGLK